MAILESKYRVSYDQYGMRVIEVTGRCTSNEDSGIRRGCTRKYRMVEIPNSVGAILKPMDGTKPRVENVTPPTIGSRVKCVKVEGYTNPFAPIQPGGSSYSGYAILTYYIRYQEVTDVA